MPTVTDARDIHRSDDTTSTAAEASTATTREAGAGKPDAGQPDAGQPGAGEHSPAGGRGQRPGDLGLALALADAADAITATRFHAVDLVVETKPDLTPVSDADRAVERELRRLLAEQRPGEAILGEEFGERGGVGSRRWVLDPIDGTKNFVRGVPVWATLLALMDGPEVTLSVVSAPALGRRWWAVRGGGAWVTEFGGEPRKLGVSAVSELADASISYAGLDCWAERGRLDHLVDLLRTCWRTRSYGDFWAHMMVAEGAVDICVEPEVSLWDLAAPALIVTEAGGRFTDLAGRPTPAGGSAVSTNGRLHAAVLNRLAS